MSAVTTTVDVQSENIPEELKEREQWLLWDADSDRKQPHWKGDVTISWSNPDDWHSFEEAAEAAQSNESWGVGYVCAVENSDYDDGEYGVIDIDGVLDEDAGGPADWLPALDRFRDAETYVEFSPSGTGAHIPFRGSPPTWWKDGQVDDHEGVDVLANKFCTFTGDTFQTSGSTVADIDVAPWLLEAYSEIHGEYPDIENNDGEEVYQGDDEDWLDDELVEDALSNLNPDASYSEWRDIAYAVHDYDSGPTGKSLFNSWSQSGSKYDSKAENQIERFWEDTNPGQGITVGSLVYMATNAGWAPDIDHGDEESTIPQIAPTDLVEMDGCYYDVDYKDGEERLNQVTNFTLESEAYVMDEDGEEYVELKLTPSSPVEDSYSEVVEWTVFNELNKFKDKVLTGMTPVFCGSRHHLNDLRLIVSHQEAPRLQKTKKIGLHDNEIVTADEVLCNGDPTYRHVSQGSAMESKFDLENIEDYDEQEVADILELLPETRDKDRILTLLGWWFASLYSPSIRGWEEEVPFAGVFGETGSGKTSVLQYLSRMIGMDVNPASARTTKFSLIKHFSATTNIPLWIDEYKPSDIEDWKVDVLHDYIRTATKGGDETRGNADKTEERYTFECPVLVSGEQVVQGSAENRRMIPIRLIKDSTNGATAENWMELTGGSIESNGTIEHYDGYDPSHHARAVWQYVLDSDDEKVEKVWKQARELAYEVAHDEGVDDLEDLELNSVAMIKFGLTIYLHFADTVGADPSISDDDVDCALRYVVSNSGLDNRESHVEEYLSLVSSAVRDGGVGPDQFRIINEGDDDEELLIKTNTMHHKVLRYIQEHGITSDVFDSAKDYKNRFSELADDDESFVVQVGKVHRDLNRCVSIDMRKADEQVDGFDRAAFVY